VNFDSPAAPAPVPPSHERLKFTGEGGEYFRIWIVNLALTIVTIGIYSAWAKVRRLQYFYRNTQLAGSGFDYHGKPSAILKGRIVTFGLFGLANAAMEFNPAVGGGLFLLIAVVLPWLLVRSLVFRMRNTSWRGLRFEFRGSVAEGYKVFLLWPLCAVLTLGLLVPFAHRQLSAYLRNNVHFGGMRASLAARPGEFYRIYFMAGLLIMTAPVVVLLLSLSTALGAGSVPPVEAIWLFLLVAVLFYVVMLSVSPYLIARVQNLTWNRTTLGPHRFRSELKPLRLIGVTLGNLLLTLFTLGLYRPFAAVRAARCRIDAVTLLPGESLETFLGRRGEDMDALGEEVSEFLDFDIAL
jgi:uncharacterized membrane protein YjgN (DUF898 family)